jgi:hypothetical protein
MAGDDPRAPVHEYLQRFFGEGVSGAIDSSVAAPGVPRLGADTGTLPEVVVEPEFLRSRSADDIALFLSEYGRVDVVRQAGTARVRVSDAGIGIEPVSSTRQ